MNPETFSREGRMRGFDFVARAPDGQLRIVTFYERNRPAALRLARTWARNFRHAIEGEGEPEEDEAA